MPMWVEKKVMAWLDKAADLIFSRVFSRRMQTVSSKLERLEAEVRELKARQKILDMASAQMKVGAKLSPKGGAWVVVSYTLGDRDFVNFYDFNGSNLGSLRSFLENFVKAGMAVRLANPFDRSKDPDRR